MTLTYIVLHKPMSKKSFDRKPRMELLITLGVPRDGIK